jgi:hypothetical protein
MDEIPQTPEGDTMSKLRLTIEIDVNTAENQWERRLAAALASAGDNAPSAVAGTVTRDDSNTPDNDGRCGGYEVPCGRWAWSVVPVSLDEISLAPPPYTCVHCRRDREAGAFDHDGNPVCQFHYEANDPDEQPCPDCEEPTHDRGVDGGRTMIEECDACGWRAEIV